MKPRLLREQEKKIRRLIGQLLKIPILRPSTREALEAESNTWHYVCDNCGISFETNSELHKGTKYRLYYCSYDCERASAEKQAQKLRTYARDYRTRKRKD